MSIQKLASLPSSYKAAAFQTMGGALVSVNIPWKDPQDGQLVVKVLACGVCHRSDLLPSQSADSGLMSFYSDNIVKYQGLNTGFPRIPGIISFTTLMTCC
jgi:NADPH:quinone reductase-like Zn-dependent oxidoreductase